MDFLVIGLFYEIIQTEKFLKCEKRFEQFDRQRQIGK